MGGINIIKNMIAEVITISPEIQSGTPVFAGTRVPVKNFFGYIKAGDTTEEFLNDFPSVAKEQVVQLLEFMICLTKIKIRL